MTRSKPSARRPSAPQAKTSRASSSTRPTGIAFFDFDHTVIRGDAGPLFGRHLFQVRRRGLSRTRRGLLWLRYTPFIFWMGVQAGLYNLRLRRRSSLVRSAYRGLRGIPSEMLGADLEAFVDEVIPPRILREVASEMRDHLAKGRRCVIVTTGMERLVTRALTHLPAGVEVIGCRLREHNGRLTGRIVGPLFGVDKANIMDAYARALSISLEDCWAYSDHYSDKQMLEAVGHAVAVNPRLRLRRLALRSGWRVLETP
jgi:HAD superfamily hydrolase (TIGR01490 family)